MPRGKVKAVNYLLPHVQRIPNRIVRDEISREIAQKLSIDSAVLRQELKQAVTNRSASSLKAPTEAQVTDAEKILIRALASANEISNNNDEHISARDGAEEPFDPARQARFAMQGDNLHTGMPAESLLSALLSAPEDANPMDLPFPPPTAICWRKPSCTTKKNSRPSASKAQFAACAASTCAAASSKFNANSPTAD